MRTSTQLKGIRSTSCLKRKKKNKTTAVGQTNMPTKYFTEREQSAVHILVQKVFMSEKRELNVAYVGGPF